MLNDVVMHLSLLTSTKHLLQVGTFFALSGAIWLTSGTTNMRTAGPPRLTNRILPLTTKGPLRRLSAACVRFNYAPASRLFLHAVLCIACVVLGLRISQEISLVVIQWSSVENRINSFDRNSEKFENLAKGLSNRDLAEAPDGLAIHDTLPHPDVRLPGPLAGSATPVNASKKTGIQVGRHPILVREWPHPDATEMMQAFSLLARVQHEQRLFYSIQDWKPIIAITPTYQRMFQALHLTGATLAQRIFQIWLTVTERLWHKAMLFLINF